MNQGYSSLARRRSAADPIHSPASSGNCGQPRGGIGDARGGPPPDGGLGRRCRKRRDKAPGAALAAGAEYPPRRRGRAIKPVQRALRRHNATRPSHADQRTSAESYSDATSSDRPGSRANRDRLAALGWAPRGGGRSLPRDVAPGLQADAPSRSRSSVKCPGLASRSRRRGRFADSRCD